MKNMCRKRQFGLCQSLIPLAPLSCTPIFSLFSFNLLDRASSSFFRCASLSLYFLICSNISHSYLSFRASPLAWNCSLTESTSSPSPGQEKLEMRRSSPRCSSFAAARLSQSGLIFFLFFVTLSAFLASCAAIAGDGVRKCGGPAT